MIYAHLFLIKMLKNLQLKPNGRAVCPELLQLKPNGDPVCPELLQLKPNGDPVCPKLPHLKPNGDTVCLQFHPQKSAYKNRTNVWFKPCVML